MGRHLSSESLFCAVPIFLSKLTYSFPLSLLIDFYSSHGRWISISMRGIIHRAIETLFFVPM